MAERDALIRELRNTNEILETKVLKLEQLVRLKDAKIAALLSKLQLGREVSVPLADVQSLSIQSKATCGAAAPVRASPYRPARHKTRE